MKYDKELTWAIIITALIVVAATGLALLFFPPEELIKLGATYEY